MRVLAIDTALATCSAAVLDSERDIMAHETLPLTQGHAEALIPLIARVMDAGKAAFGDLDRIAVTTGPGSFTGLRVGIAAARGIALAAARPAVGFTTFAVFAAPHRAADGAAAIAVAIDARHDQVYLQIFAPQGRALAPCVAHIRDAARAAASAGPAIVAGSAADLLAAAWPAHAPAPKLVEQCAAPDIAWLARLGADAQEQGAPRPFYLRPPDARPQQAGALRR